MPSKNPSTPTRTRATKSTPRPTAPRRRTATRTNPPAETVADEAVSAEPAIDAPVASTIDYAEQVRIRAYFLHLERKGRPGNPVEDWLAAERELGTDARPEA